MKASLGHLIYPTVPYIRSPKYDVVVYEMIYTSDSLAQSALCKTELHMCTSWMYEGGETPTLALKMKCTEVSVRDIGYLKTDLFEG